MKNWYVYLYYFVLMSGLLIFVGYMFYKSGEIFPPTPPQGYETDELSKWTEQDLNRLYVSMECRKLPLFSSEVPDDLKDLNQKCRKVRSVLVNKTQEREIEELRKSLNNLESK